MEANGGRGIVPESRITVTLLKGARPPVRYAATALRDDGVHAVARAPWAGPPVRDFGFVRFERGDVFIEHFWRDRWFTVKEVWSGDGEHKGWYCDMVRPAEVEPARVTVRDLELDLWVSADGSEVLRLDEDEFAASGLGESDPEAAAEAVRALDELESLAHRTGLAPLLV